MLHILNLVAISLLTRLISLPRSNNTGACSCCSSLEQHVIMLINENLTLRHQCALYMQSIKKPPIRFLDRVFWVMNSKINKKWRDALTFVQPATVIKWHKTLFRFLWRWKSRTGGRPKIAPEIRNLIKLMRTENTGWGAEKIHIQLCLLGFSGAVRLSTVKNYLKRFGPRHKTDPKLIRNWVAFLRNYAEQTMSVDFGHVITSSFQRISFFLVLSNDRRKIVHFHVTAQPDQDWVVQQIRNTFYDIRAPRYLMRDRDPLYGKTFNAIIKNYGIEALPTAPYSPWQNPYVERVIGTIRTECLNHVLIRNQNQLYRILGEYIAYYNNYRPHRALKNSPNPQKICNKKDGNVVSIPVLGGLHHIYQRKAA